MQITSLLKKTLTAAAAVATLASVPVVTAQPAAAFGNRGFGGPIFRHGGGYGGGYGGYRGGYYRGGRGLGYGLAGFGLGLGVGSLYGGYGAYGSPYGGYGYGYDGAGYGGYGGCLRRVYGYYGPHLVRVC